MKHTVLNCVVLMLILSLALPVFALAESDQPLTRMETIEGAQGEKEEIETTYFVSDKGYAFWYDASIIMPVLDIETTESSVDLFCPQPENPLDVSMAINVVPASEDVSVEEEMALIQAAMVEEGFDRVIPITMDDKFNDFAASEGCFGMNAENQLRIQYVLADENGVTYDIAITFPVEVEESVGLRIEHMVLTSFEVIQ